MKINGFRCWLVEGIKYNRTLVKVHTDEGLTVVAEATNWPGSPMILAACDHLGKLLIGEVLAGSTIFGPGRIAI